MNLYTTSALLRLPDPTWLIERLYPTGAFVVLYGPPGHGKSFVALDWSLHIATGQLWQGLPARQGPVIYIAAEGRGGLALRVDAWLTHHRIQDDPPILFSLQPLDLSDTGADELITACQAIILNGEGPHELFPALIVVDTLARCFGGDENETADMARFVANIDTLRQELHATVLIVHHVGKDRDRGERGSSVLRGAADTMIRSSKLGKELKDGLRLKCSKQKEAPEFEDIELQVTSVKDSYVITPGLVTAEQALQHVQADPSFTSDRQRALKLASLTGLAFERCRHRLRKARL